MRKRLRQWALENGVSAAKLEPFLENTRTGAAELDLRNLGLKILPLAELQEFSWLRTVKVSPRLLRVAGRTAGALRRNTNAPLDWDSAQRGVGRWNSTLPRPASDERIVLFIEAYAAQSKTLDLRGKGLRSVPDVVADFPHLRTVTVSPEFLCGR